MSTTAESLQPQQEEDGVVDSPKTSPPDEPSSPGPSSAQQKEKETSISSLQGAEPAEDASSDRPPSPPPPPTEPSSSLLKAAAPAPSTATTTPSSPNKQQTLPPPASSEPPLPAKRPSAWRRPAVSVAAQTEQKAAQKAKEQRARQERRLWQDVVTIRIPLAATADLGIALNRTRTKRAAALMEAFPALREKDKPEEPDNDNDEVDDEDDEAADKDGPKKKKKKVTPVARPKPTNMPQPREYANMLDYLEAKYIQGVMVEEQAVDENDDEGQGSVYSDESSSFLDDRDLQRHVAEQVLAHTTVTKLELQNEENEFFVNVGNLEVEETEMTQAKYDPLKDVNKATVKRKRKNPAPKSTTSSVGSNKTKASKASTATAKTTKKNGKAESGGPATSSVQQPPKKKSKPATTTAAAKDSDTKSTTSKKKKTDTPKPIASPSSPSNTVTTSDQTVLERKSHLRKERVDTLYDQLVDLIQNATADELPRTKTKVSLTCPQDKGPGDEVTFTNPHVAGQKLRVKIPKSAKPGHTFRVTVPVVTTNDGNGDDDKETDHNKFSRAFYDTLEEYARAYDEWCDAQGDWKKASGDKEFAAHTAKRLKFDTLVTVFPNADLRTPIDKPYMQKILRRARQNKHKREQTLARQKMLQEEEGGKKDEEEQVEEAEAPAAPAAMEKAPVRTIRAPTLGTVFPKVAFDANAFQTRY